MQLVLCAAQHWWIIKWYTDWVKRSPTFVSWQGRAPPSTPRLTSLPQRWPTKLARCTLWVGRRACTLWSWEERGRHIEFSFTQTLISAGFSFTTAELQHQTITLARNVALRALLWDSFSILFHLLNTDIFESNHSQFTKPRIPEKCILSNVYLLDRDCSHEGAGIWSWL